MKEPQQDLDKSRYLRQTPVPRHMRQMNFESRMWFNDILSLGVDARGLWQDDLGSTQGNSDSVYLPTPLCA